MMDEVDRMALISDERHHDNINIDGFDLTVIKGVAPFSYFDGMMIQQRADMTKDEDVINVIKKQVKQRQDSIAQFKAGNRIDLAQKEEKELIVLKSYLPPEMSTEQLKNIVEEVVSASGATSIKDMGRVMKDVLSKVKGQADNQAISALVKERLTRM